jgi:putative transcriptional regulator
MRVLKMSDGYLEGQLLIAMPNMGDPRFERTVVFICAHSEEGAMGLILNKIADEITFNDLLEQLEVDRPAPQEEIRIHAGGPVDTGRGFVLHSRDYLQATTMTVGDKYGLTATIDILKSIADGDGPNHSLLALGYAGWGAGQLDSEIQANGWLTVDPDAEIVFDEEIDTKWDRAVKKLGVDPSFLTSEAGHA